MRQIRSKLLLPAVAVFGLALCAGQAHACPNCKEAVSTSTSELGNMSRGYNWSVCFMLAVPFTLLGTGAFLVHRAAKRGFFPEL
jgi:hypothetical protein